MQAAERERVQALELEREERRGAEVAELQAREAAKQRTEQERRKEVGITTRQIQIIIKLSKNIKNKNEHNAN